MKRFPLSTNTVAFILFASFIISCKKQAKDDNPQTVDPNPVLANNYEQAYPGIHGETVSFAYGIDSIHVEKKGDKYVWLGDIVFDKATLETLISHGGILRNGRKAVPDHDLNRTFTNDFAHIWPSRQVFFTIQSGFSAAEQTMITNAINHWQANTPLTFIQRTNQSNYVQFVPGSVNSGLYSNYIGMKGGQQIINLETGAFGTGNVIHEIGHAVGLIHEQCRNDRGNAILVNYDNVSPHTSQNIYQFQTYNEQNQSGWQIDAFDFGSVMLYGSFAFSDNVNPVMTRLDGTTFIGQRFGLSAGDIQTINYIYLPVFARTTYIVTDEGGDNYYNYREGYVVVNFYQDANGTIPATLPYPIDLHYGTYSTGDCQSYSLNATDMIIPAGNPGQIQIGSFSSYNSYDSQGNPISCRSSETGLIPGIGYWPQ